MHIHCGTVVAAVVSWLLVIGRDEAFNVTSSCSTAGNLAVRGSSCAFPCSLSPKVGCADEEYGSARPSSLFEAELSVDLGGFCWLAVG